MKIAIIGTGISGNIAAYLLNQAHDITVYEKNNYIGGHSRTLEIDYDGKKIPVDTGFIVFNYRNYPLLTGMFKHLEVEAEKSDMSFAASINNSWLEYNTQSLAKLFAQKKNLLRPKYIGMLKDITSFFKESKLILESGEIDMNLGEFVKNLGLGDWFKRYFLYPMGGAIWSCPIEQMLQFPAYTFIRFFENHGLLATEGQPQWYTVTGGSKQYVEKLTASFDDKVRLNCAVKSIKRDNNKVEVTDQNGNTEVYDHVVMASHADESLKILSDATHEEKAILSNFTYQKNIAYLHRDVSLMPKNKNAWASWVYLSKEKEDKTPDISVSYWMNLLQNIDDKYPLFVTLNPHTEPDPELVFNRHEFHHPVFTKNAIKAQKEIELIQGKNNTWFCGAYQRYGFHEDGMMSGVNVAKELGVDLPWQES